MRLRVRESVVTCVLVLFFSRFTSAAELRWQAPADCSADEFTARMELVLGHPLSQVKDRELRVDVARKATRDWTLTFSWLDATGQNLGRRELRGTGCADVTRAGAVAAAMALQADESQHPKPTGEAPTNTPGNTQAVTSTKSEPAESVETPTQTAPTSSSKNESLAVTQPHTRSIPWLVRLALVGDAGTLREPALGPAVDVGLYWQWLAGGLGGVAFPVAQREASAGRGGDFALFAGQLWLCVRPLGKQWVPLGCVNYELGSLSGRGAGDRVNRSWSRTALWHALRPELGLALPLGWNLELDVRLGVSIALTRPDFVLDGDLSILQPQRFSPRAALGLRWAP